MRYCFSNWVFPNNSGAYTRRNQENADRFAVIKYGIHGFNGSAQLLQGDWSSCTHSLATLKVTTSCFLNWNRCPPIVVECSFKWFCLTVIWSSFDGQHDERPWPYTVVIVKFSEWGWLGHYRVIACPSISLEFNRVDTFQPWHGIWCAVWGYALEEKISKLLLLQPFQWLYL